MGVKPHWHAQEVSRRSEGTSPWSPYGPITDRWEVNHTVAYGTYEEARDEVPLRDNTIVKCTDPVCAPAARESE